MVNFHRVASGESIVELINAPKMSSGGPQVQRSTINRLLSLARIWYSWSRSAHGVSESFPFTRGLTLIDVYKMGASSMLPLHSNRAFSLPPD